MTSQFELRKTLFVVFQQLVYSLKQRIIGWLIDRNLNDFVAGLNTSSCCLFAWLLFLFSVEFAID